MKQVILNYLKNSKSDEFKASKLEEYFNEKLALLKYHKSNLEQQNKEIQNKYRDQCLEQLSLNEQFYDLQTENKELIEVINECDDYLKGNKLNYIGNGSILHTKMKKALKTNKK